MPQTLWPEIGRGMALQKGYWELGRQKPQLSPPEPCHVIWELRTVGCGVWGTKLGTCQAPGTRVWNPATPHAPQHQWMHHPKLAASSPPFSSFHFSPPGFCIFSGISDFFFNTEKKDFFKASSWMLSSEELFLVCLLLSPTLQRCAPVRLLPEQMRQLWGQGPGLGRGRGDSGRPRPH